MTLNGQIVPFVHHQYVLSNIKYKDRSIYTSIYDDCVIHDSKPLISVKMMPKPL